MGASVGKLVDPPKELPSARRGHVYCRIGVWRTGTDFDEFSCEPLRRADHYRAAVLDLDSEKLTVVFKNYY